jgi:4-amino-4-deoxy-L-arabinose transferase-like glycosyltransferase
MKFLTAPFHENFKYPKLFLVVLGAVFFLPFLGSVHLFDWDEINFAESAREMMITGDYLRVRINFVPFWEKPPFFFWMQVLSMKVFGVNEFAARFPNAVCGIITLLVFYQIGKSLYGHRFGMLWALLYFGALLPHMYFKSGIIDPIFNLFIFLGVYFLLQVIEANENKRRKNAVLGGLFTGLAVLTKGPVGLLLVLLAFLVYWISVKFKRVARISDVLIFAGMVFLVSSAWFGYETFKNGPWFLVEFIQYQIDLFRTPVAGHQQPLYYHFVVVLIGCFPMSVLAIPKLIRNRAENDVPLNMARWMRYLFWVVMILFTIVTTKIVHYSSMAYFPLSFLAAFQIHQWMEAGKQPRKWQLIFNLVVGLILAGIIAAVPYLMHNKDLLMNLITSDFGKASLSINVPMLGWEWVIGVVFLLAVTGTFILYRKNELPAAVSLSGFVLAATLLWYGALVLPKIEKYSQAPAVEFYEKMAGEDVYIHTFRFKSYADYFYARKMPMQNENALDGNWLLTGEIDKPVYLVTKVNKMKFMTEYPAFELMYQKGGFVFYRRMP